MHTSLLSFLKKHVPEIILFTVFFIFASFLMWKTFKLTPEGDIQIASKAWSDFAATLPLIRSFSYGDNFPPQYPIFAGPPIRYHFIFFMIVGFLEKIGIPLDWVLNSISTLGFFLLLIAIYLIGKIIFKSKAVGTFAAILFLFNGSFGFLEFFKKNPLSLNTISDIINNANFSSFGPYDGNIVSAFWNLNIYTNQRHLALAYSLYLFLLLVIYKFSKKPKAFSWSKSLIIGILLGLTPYLHFSVFVMSGYTLILFLIIYPKIRLKIFTTGFIALLFAIPQYLYMGQSEVAVKFFDPGYLVENLTFQNFTKYWFLNLGITTILAPLGLILAKKEQRKIILPFLSFFVIGNLFQFTPDMPTNHKFFNLFLIGINFFTAFFLYKIFLKNILGKVIAIIIFPLLILSGVIDIFPIVNDRYMTIQDIPNDKVAKFIAENTPKDAVFLNAQFLYDPASIAGRKIYMGWPYFAWSAGYDTGIRNSIMKGLFNPSNINDLCRQLKKENIKYIEIQNPTPLESININYEFFTKNFKEIFYGDESKTRIYDVNASCITYKAI